VAAGPEETALQCYGRAHAAGVAPLLSTYKLLLRVCAAADLWAEVDQLAVHLLRDGAEVRRAPTLKLAIRRIR
jgi:hypothetical protein